MSLAGRLENRHFLVVDDEEFVRALVARFLKRSGAAGVVEAADGREAIAAIASYEMVFDAIISDVKMRPMNGIELLRAIRTGAEGLKRNTPIVMLTAHAEAELVEQALALDADAFVVKPVKREALLERVLRVLQRAVPLRRRRISWFPSRPSPHRASTEMRREVSLAQRRARPSRCRRRSRSARSKRIRSSRKTFISSIRRVCC
jgi:CheY-like chemotaxis protein